LAKELIIGAASGYEWDKLKYWVNSIQASGFSGKVALVATDMSKTTIDKLVEKGVELSLFGTPQPDGGVKAPANNAPHVERFFYLWNYLNQNQGKFDRVITTDTRDVIFQKNPTYKLDDLLRYHDLIASSEGMRYQNEPWGNANLFQSFGPYFHNRLKDKLINNVGVIAGHAYQVEGLLSLLFHLSLNRPIPIVDQAVYNFILNENAFHGMTNFTTNEDHWAVNLGTSIEAVKSGHGEIGESCRGDATKFAKYTIDYEDKQPVFDKEDGTVTCPGGTLGEFVIVHQWDRIPELKGLVERKYA
jgi:hypothetical protein